MSALVQHLAMVSESASTATGDLLRVSASLQKQVTRDLAPIWQVSATVDAFATLEDVPDGYWPVIIRDDIGIDANGTHMDDDGQPLALISSSSDLDTWSLAASHEAMEMLVDPSGKRQVTGDSPKPGQGRVSILVEVCDPCTAAEFAYSVNGIRVSDFFTPQYFDPVAAGGVRYSFTGAITAPRQVLRGGYLSWKEPVSGHWWQKTWFTGNAPVFLDRGTADPQNGSLRSYIDRFTAAQTAKAFSAGRKKSRAAGMDVTVGLRSSRSNAVMWRQQIDSILERSRQKSPNRDTRPGYRAGRK